MKFKKGDRVKHKEFELIGVVESTRYGTSPMLSSTIQLSGVDGEDNWLRESDFEKIEVPKVPQAPQALDDYVKKFSSIVPKEKILFDLLGDFRDGNQEIDEELYSWIYLNRKKAIDAILNGYEVEQEPLYRVILPAVLNPILHQRISDGRFVFLKEFKVFDDDFKYNFTEKEIKAFHEDYWQYAVKVEEEEE